MAPSYASSRGFVGCHADTSIEYIRWLLMIGMRRSGSKNSRTRLYASFTVTLKAELEDCNLGEYQIRG